MNMRILLLTLMGLIIMTALYYRSSWSAHSADTQHYLIALTELVFEDFSRTFDGKPRIVEVALWYPTNQTTPMQKIEFGIWKIKDAIRNAPVLSNKKLPLIIFSHGYSGNQWVNTWFPEYLAKQGYIVAVIRHYGNSYRNMIPELCARPWHRPKDMSFVLDELLKHPQFEEHIDRNRIGAAGFSQGGMACIWLAGAQAMLTSEILNRQITVVNDPELRMLHFKDIALDRLNAVLEDFTKEDFEQANQSYYDERFKAAFAIAPGIDEENLMFTAEGLSKASLPVHITIGEADTGLIEQAQFFSKHIPESTFTLIPGYVTHMTLLNEGTESGKLTKPAFTLDHSSINRGEIHKAVAAEALSFFNKYLVQ
jgi:predicted dienelactone hydrolase